MSTMRTVLSSMSPEAHEALPAHSRHVGFPAGSRILGGRGGADRFRITEADSVVLGLHVAGHKAAVVETIGYGELLGRPWMLPPRARRLDATATHPVRAPEFDAQAVRELCAEDSGSGRSASIGVAVIAHSGTPRPVTARSPCTPPPAAAPGSPAPAEDSAGPSIRSREQGP
ncbi:hypothetical protein ABZS81_28650 [Streptomyces sp. NPDC005318]|uniref:hypothetical protein n=1 Tax=Streptomyces sp. NPDC005318 TaxID=3157031 RepID=UPI0033B2D6C6